MSTITATALPSLGIVRLDLDFTAESAPYVYVTRVNELTGAATPVRTHGMTGTAPGQAGLSGVAYQSIAAGYRGTVFDTEAPRDVPIHYVATSTQWQVNVRSTFDGATVDPWTGANNARVLPGYETLYSTRPALAFAGDGVTATPWLLSELVTALPGGRFTASVYLRPPTPAYVYNLYVAWYDASAALLSASLVATGSGNGVASVTLTGTSAAAPASTAFARLRLEIAGTPTANSTFIFSAKLLSIAGTATSATVTLANLDTFWLRDPLRPALDVAVTLCFDDPLCIPTQGIFFSAMGTEAYAARSGDFDIANQRDPVTVSRRRSSRSSTLALVTRTFADRDRLNALLAPGTPLLWQVPPQYGIPDAYLSIADAQVNAFLPDLTDQARMFTMPFRVESYPGGGAQGVTGSRWADLCGQTWGTVNGLGLTFQQVVQGLAA